MPSSKARRIACLSVLVCAPGACGRDSSGVPGGSGSSGAVVASSGSTASSGLAGAGANASTGAPTAGSSSGSANGVQDAGLPIDSGNVAAGDSAVPDLSETGAPRPAAEGGSTAWTCPPGPFGNPIPSGAVPVRVQGVPPNDASFNMNNGTFGIIEGPVWLGDSLYVSEIAAGPNPPASRILKVTPAGMVSVAVANSGTNGLAVDRSGNLYGAVHKDGSVSRIDLSAGTATPVASSFMGARFNSPNDLALRSDGTIYFSDPDYQAPSTRPQLKTRLYRVAPGTNAVTVVDDTLSEPNGVTFSLDEKTLFVTTPGGIHKYSVMADGSVGPSSVMMPVVSSGDGMTLDCAGNLYVATPTAIVVLSPSGSEIGRIPVTAGVQSATNVAFGGADHKTLYITALGSGTQKGLLQIALATPGLPY
ncbi:MAG: SMP-30/gluconolactonase/LRE family protein [Myxococcota bacterium]|nr:SMP-30/gluconolactonase/LRE family protein [Myxococcota bacterium]